MTDVIIVGVASSEVEQMLAGGVGPPLPAGARCPACGGALGPFGRRGYPRYVRAEGKLTRFRVLRAICRSCAGTHALLSSFLHPRRFDVVASIGAALIGGAAGRGYRPLAQALVVPLETLRDWLRALRRGALPLRAVFLGFASALGAPAPRPPPGGSPLAWLVQAICEAFAAARDRLGEWAVAGGVWAFASAACGGTLLAYRDPL